MNLMHSLENKYTLENKNQTRNQFWSPEPKNHEWEIISEPKTAKLETTAILKQDVGAHAYVLDPLTRPAISGSCGSRENDRSGRRERNHVYTLLADANKWHF